MARIALMILTAVVLAIHTESVPIPDNAALVVTTTETSSTAVSSDTTVASEVPTSSALQESKAPPPKIYSMHINSDIEFRFAKTLVTSRVANPANQSQEVKFSVVLPQDAFITGFVMEIDGKSYRAYVKEKEEAKKTYDEAIQFGQAAAHVAYSARESNSFDVNVNIEPLKKVTFNLTYEELLKRSKGLYHHVVTISPGQVVPDMLVKVHIKEPRNITKLYTPKFSSENKVSDVDDDPCSSDSTNSSVCTSGNEIARKNLLSPTEAVVEFGPTLEEQKKLSQDKGKGLSGQFEVLYDVQRDPTGGEVLVKDGYFVHFFAPTDLQILPKHIVFVLDVSGSMMGRKIVQVKDAMRTILASLQPDDYFNVIVFSSQVTSWDLDHPEADLVTDRDPYYYNPYGETTPTTTLAPNPREAVPAYPANQEYIQKALKRINETEANGSTNIFGGLKQAVITIKKHRELLQKNGDLKARKSIVMFLTDGEANVGESRPDYIISGLSELNTAPQAPIYSLTFGEDGNIDFLTKLSLANSGLARVIYEGADADIQLKRFYIDISSPLLSDVTFKYLPKEVDLDSTTKIHYHTYYQGGELVVAGRTADKEVKEINGDVSADAKGTANKQYPVKSLPFEGPQLILIDDIILPPPREHVKERPTTSLERAWAYLTVKQLIEDYEAEASKKHEPSTDLGAGTGNPFQSAPGYPVPLPAPGIPAPPPAPGTLVPLPAPGSPVPLPAPGSAPSAPPTTSDLTSTTEASSSTTSSSEIISSTTSPTNTTEKINAKKQKALDLALKYSFVTKLTSLVVVKPNATQATEAKRIVSGENGGAAGFGGYAAGLSGAPGVPAPPRVALFSSPGAPAPSYASPAGLPAPPRAGGVAYNIVPAGAAQGYSTTFMPWSLPALSAAPSSISNQVAKGGSGGGGGGGSAGTFASASGPGLGGGFIRPNSLHLPTFSYGFPGFATANALPQHQSLASFPGIGGAPPPLQYSVHRDSIQTQSSSAISFSGSFPMRNKFAVIPVSASSVDSPEVSVDRVDSLIVEDDVSQLAVTTIAPAATELPSSNPSPVTNSSETTIAPGHEEPAVPDPLDKLSLSDVTWLSKEALNSGTVELDVKGQKKQYSVLSNADSNNSTTPSACTAPGISSGKCRHLSQCVLRAVVSSVESYLPFQCQLENYLAVCCVD